MNKLIPFLFVISVVACTEITYNEPQPRGITSLASVPVKIQGTYLWKEDTITFFERGFRAKDKKEDVLFLSDSIVIKNYKNHYFISYRESGEWLLRILKPLKNGDLIYLEMENVPEEEPKRKLFLDRLSKETPVIKNTVDSVTHYLINPSPKKLLTLVKRGYFQEKGTLLKIKSVITN